jgi:uncharacterized protein
MTIELRPFSVACNLKCTYCYQEPQRIKENISNNYDLQKMKKSVEEIGEPFTVFGGEPLLIPKKDLEEIFLWGYKISKKNSIQTNGTLIDDDHITLFKRFKVHVGISIDGPGELNDLRFLQNFQTTRRYKKKPN